MKLDEIEGFVDEPACEVPAHTAAPRAARLSESKREGGSLAALPERPKLGQPSRSNARAPSGLFYTRVDTLRGRPHERL